MNVAAFNVSGCCPIVEKRDKISKMFLRWKLDVCALRETNLKGKCEVMFGEVVGRVSGVRGGCEGAVTE